MALDQRRSQRPSPAEWHSSSGALRAADFAEVGAEQGRQMRGVGVVLFAATVGRQSRGNESQPLLHSHHPSSRPLTAENTLHGHAHDPSETTLSQRQRVESSMCTVSSAD